MRALIVYESMFGNTRRVAETIAAGMAQAAEVEVVEVGQAPTDLSPWDLVIIGAPTHAHGLSSADSRASAARMAAKDDLGELVSRGRCMRDWLEALSGLEGQAVATFDTRIKGPRLLWGSAARTIEKRLKKRGCELRGSESILIAMKPPVDGFLDGELERARGWGASLAA